jgi:hypothetical protein
MYLSSISDGHTRRLHARSLPLNNSRESEESTAPASPRAAPPLLGAVVRAGQEEAIAEVLAGSAPRPLRSPVNPLSPVRRVRLILELAAWTLFALWFIQVSAPFAFSAVKNPDHASSLRALSASVVNPGLAQLPAAEPSQIGAWLVSASAVLSAAALARQFRRKTPIEAEFLTRKEFQDFKDKEFADLRNRVDQSFRSLSDKLDGINERLHDVRSLVDRLDERSKHFPSPNPITTRKS